MGTFLTLWRHSSLDTIRLESRLRTKITMNMNRRAGTILPRLRDCESASDVLRVVHQEFVRWFDAGNAGPEGRYAEIASEIWQMWQPYRHRAPDASSRK